MVYGKAEDFFDFVECQLNAVFGSSLQDLPEGEVFAHEVIYSSQGLSCQITSIDGPLGSILARVRARHTKPQNALDYLTCYAKRKLSLTSVIQRGIHPLCRRPCKEKPVSGMVNFIRIRKFVLNQFR